MSFIPREAAKIVGDCATSRVYAALKTGELVGRRAARRKTLIRRED